MSHIIKESQWLAAIDLVKDRYVLLSDFQKELSWLIPPTSKDRIGIIVEDKTLENGTSCKEIYQEAESNHTAEDRL